MDSTNNMKDLISYTKTIIKTKSSATVSPVDLDLVLNLIVPIIYKLGYNDGRNEGIQFTRKMFNIGNDTVD